MPFYNIIENIRNVITNPVNFKNVENNTTIKSVDQKYFSRNT